MKAVYDAVLATPTGYVGVVTREGCLVRLDTGLRRRCPAPPANATAERVAEALAAYFEDPRYAFGLELDLAGTVFQRRVWRALVDIPPGRTLSYGALANRLGTSARAVGGACRANPCPIVVPCHRVVAADGGLGGYSGAREGRWLEMKRALLEHEGAWS